VVEPYKIEGDWATNALGVPSPLSTKHYGNIELCLMKAIRETFPSAAILIGGKDIKGDVYIKIKDTGVSWGPKCFMEYSAVIKGKEITEKTSHGEFFVLSVHSFYKRAYAIVCDKVVQKIQSELLTKKI
jgi:hypothetical protein